MNREVINPQELPAVNSTYSQAIKAKGLVFVAGQIGIDPATGKLISGDIAEQARQAIENTATILKAAGSSLEIVVSTTLYLTDAVPGRDRQRHSLLAAGSAPFPLPAKEHRDIFPQRRRTAAHPVSGGRKPLQSGVEVAADLQTPGSQRLPRPVSNLSGLDQKNTIRVV